MRAIVISDLLSGIRVDVESLEWESLFSDRDRLKKSSFSRHWPAIVYIYDDNAMQINKSIWPVATMSTCANRNKVSHVPWISIKDWFNSLAGNNRVTWWRYGLRMNWITWIICGQLKKLSSPYCDTVIRPILASGLIFSPFDKNRYFNFNRFLYFAKHFLTFNLS